MDWKRVYATHEEAQGLSTGPWRSDYFPGVALPSTKALYKWIIVRYGDLWTCAQVMDVGPWMVDDHDYVFGNAKPYAELHKGEWLDSNRGKAGLQAPTVQGRKVTSNGAGIDLFPATALALKIPLGKNVEVDWKFVTFPMIEG